jgi:Cdc6-like AAA superfamily ATPase
MLENTVNLEKPWLRKDEYNKIWVLLEMFMESIIPVSMLVIASGETGSGKTTLAKKIMLDATSTWENLRTIYLDTESENRHGLFAVLQKAWNLNGYSAVEILHALEDSKNKFLIVIDNAESIVDKGFARDLSKISEGFPNGGFFLLIIFGSKTIPFDVLNVSPPSYFIYFSSYGFSEIRMVLDSFLSRIESSPVDDEALNMISRVSGGNASLALSILKLASSISGGRPICKKHVLEALRKISENPFICNINRINDHHAKFILKVLSQYPQGIRLRKLFEEYSRTCVDNGIKPLKYTQLWKRIRVLEKKMLLDFRVVNLRKGRTGIVRTSCLNGETAL